ncbi:hypothetical protein [Pseudoxanthomonas sp. UC19_8]|uniref:hypothetical protein n=1 Tax=Pseudoxanthomonas sp. UC19_8 TaxID=3350175 RepID=UPI0036D3E08D
MASLNKSQFGPSIYFATDKNIFDALNEHKVDSSTMAELFLDRNTIVSATRDRVSLAFYFSKMNHDFYDHQRISQRLGVIPRRERMTSVELFGDVAAEELRGAIEKIKNDYEGTGDKVTVSKMADGFMVDIQYSKIDYRKSEFNQVQVRDGFLDIRSKDGKVIIRSSQNSYVDGFRDSFVGNLERVTDKDLQRFDVSLFEFTSPSIRSKFFYDLFSGLPGYAFQDVTDVYVYKPRSGVMSGDVDLESPQVERVALRGSGVSKTKIFRDLAADGYYTVRVTWVAKNIYEEGHLYTIEAVFTDPVACAGFSYVVLGVNERDGVEFRKARRTPTKGESSRISNAIEDYARTLILALKSSEPKDDNKSIDLGADSAEDDV